MFDATGSTDGEGRIVEYRWDFDGDSIYDADGTDSVVVHRYATAGERHVALQIVDDAGNVASTTRTVTVQSNWSPLAGFTYSPATPAVDEGVTFDGSDSEDPDGMVVEYRWDFDGDGTFDDARATPTTLHSYPTPGSYTVVLEVVDGDGATDRTTRTLMVSAG